MEIKCGDVVYWARIHPSTNIYEVVELHVRMVENNWFSGFEAKRDKQTFILSKDQIGKDVFFNRGDVLEIVKDAQAHRNDKLVENDLGDVELEDVDE